MPYSLIVLCGGQSGTYDPIVLLFTKVRTSLLVLICNMQMYQWTDQNSNGSLPTYPPTKINICFISQQNMILVNN